MFGRKKQDESGAGTRTGTMPAGQVERRVPIRARGGVSLGSVLTGVVVALGALVLISAILVGVLTHFGYSQSDLTAGKIVNAGVGAGIGLVIAQLLAYLWGGYTAGRMARGAGVINGFLVPLFAILIAIVVGAIVNALGDINLNLPFSSNNTQLVDYATGFGIAALVAMFLGGILGGAMGQRWHTKLERGVLEREEAVRDEERTAAPAAAPAPAAERRPATGTDETQHTEPRRGESSQTQSTEEGTRAPRGSDSRS